MTAQRERYRVTVICVDGRVVVASARRSGDAWRAVIGRRWLSGSFTCWQAALGHACLSVGGVCYRCVERLANAERAS
jgi:hypothetical protein